MIRDRNINALPFGGYVALHSGLFLHAQSESELASVMAHEISHVTQRHLARSMEEQARRSPRQSQRLPVHYCWRLPPQKQELRRSTPPWRAASKARLTTRAAMKEADRFGIATLAKAGFDANAMPQFFTRLADEYRYASKPPLCC